MRAIALFATLFAAGSAWALRPTVASQNDFSVGAHAVIVVDSVAGAVELTAGPAGRVHVDVARHADSEEVARGLQVTTQKEGNTVRIRFAHADGGWHDNASVDFHITAPADARLEITTGGGGVRARGFAGGMQVHTGGGSIDVDDVAGALALRTGGGSIEARRLRGTVDAETGGGSIHVEGALSGANRVSTGGGSIHVAIPAASRLRVDAHTGAGRAHNDFGLADDGQWPSSRFRGNIGDGSGGTLELRSGAGSIQLSKEG